jgi:hypothetical protein
LKGLNRNRTVAVNALSFDMPEAQLTTTTG